MDDAIKTTSFMDVMPPQRRAKPKTHAAHPHHVNAHHKIPEKSRTLMRGAVHKPHHPVASKPIVQTPIDVQSSPFSNQEFSVRPELKRAAAHVEKNPLVKRFAPATLAEPVEQVASEPIEQIYEEAYLPQAEASEAVMEQPSLGLFNSSLMHATAQDMPALHEPFNWSLVKKLSGWSALVFALLIVATAGILVYENMSRIDFYLASRQVGFSATLPKDAPSGYGLGSISTASSEIQASFKSNSDGRNYSINEKKSDQSTTILENTYVQNTAGLNYQTVQTDGLTIFIYGSHNATWVNKGIWYIIQDNNSLSDQQIISIATSM